MLACGVCVFKFPSKIVWKTLNPLTRWRATFFIQQTTLSRPSDFTLIYMCKDYKFALPAFSIFKIMLSMWSVQPHVFTHVSIFIDLLCLFDPCLSAYRSFAKRRQYGLMCTHLLQILMLFIFTSQPYIKEISSEWLSFQPPLKLEINYNQNVWVDHDCICCSNLKCVFTSVAKKKAGLFATYPATTNFSKAEVTPYSTLQSCCFCKQA